MYALVTSKSHDGWKVTQIKEKKREGHRHVRRPGYEDQSNSNIKSVVIRMVPEKTLMFFFSNTFSNRTTRIFVRKVPDHRLSKWSPDVEDPLIIARGVTSAILSSCLENHMDDVQISTIVVKLSHCVPT